MRVDFKVPEEMNEQRKALKVSWKEVLTVGIASLKRKNVLDINAVEDSLKQSVLHLQNAWSLIKQSKKEGA